LRLDLAHVDVAGVLEGAADGVPRDLVEEDAAEARPSTAAALAVAVVAELLRHVVGDGLTFPVRVGREDDLLGGLDFLLQLLDDLALASDGDVAGLEAVLDVDAQLVLGQVPDVAHRGADLEPGAQILADGPGLGRRFDDHEPALLLLFRHLSQSVLRPPRARAPGGRLSHPSRPRTRRGSVHRSGARSRRSPPRPRRGRGRPRPQPRRPGGRTTRARTAGGGPAPAGPAPRAAVGGSGRAWRGGRLPRVTPAARPPASRARGVRATRAA